MIGCLVFASLGNAVPGNSAAAAEIQDNEQMQTESVSGGDDLPGTEGTGESTSQTELDYILGRKMTEEEERRQIELFDSFISQSSYEEMEGDTADIKTGGDAALIDWVYLPSAYDSRDVDGACYITPVRSQNPYGTCWAFSAIACMEANLVKNGYADLSVDLSERHLAYFSNNSVPDQLGNSGRDESYYTGGDLYQAGGNTTIAYRALAAWRGAVEESFCPYEGIPEVPDTSMAGVYDNDFAHLTGYYLIDSTDMDAVKSAVMEYGAVSISYYASSGYLNASTAAYYCDESHSTNHAVTVVGWDDNYSKENFKSQPSSDGAWLVKNSWGTSVGDQGYFWLSYEDKTIYKQVRAFEAEIADNADNNYQYDTVTGGRRLSGTGGKDFAAVYTVKGNQGAKEKLTAVSIELYSPAEVNYSLQIYKNLRDAADPTSGEAVLSVPQTGFMKHVGYYTIPLDETVLLEQGDVFSVVFTLTKESTSFVYVAIETDYEGDYYSNATAESGQDFIRWGNVDWQDSGAQRDANLRMKAFTENTDILSVACSGVEISQKTAELYTGDSLQLSAEVLPQDVGNKSCGWSSSDTGVVRVSDTGLVEAVGEGTATVEVLTLNGRYTASCEITVKKRVMAQEILLSPLEIKLGVGQKTKLTATIMPEDVTDDRISWSSSEESIVSVEEDGTVHALREGSANIVAMAEDGSGVSAICPVTVRMVQPPAFQVKGIIGGRQVTFASATEDAVIYYSTSSSQLTTDDLCVENGETVVFENFYGTVYARAYYDGVWSNVARLILKIPVVNTPTITRNGGIISIKTTTPDSTIYYTTDGSTPSLTNGTRMGSSGGSFSFVGGTVKAIAVRSCFTNSEVASASISSCVSASVGVPSFGVKGVIGGRAVTFSSSTPGSRIYYSTSSAMTTNDKWVQNGKSVTFENFYGTIYARTYVDGKWSNVSRLILKIPVVNQPTITAAGTGKVKISTSTPNCAIYYTTDGSTPSPGNGTKINASSGIVTVGTGKTVKAIAVRSCFTNSSVETYYD